LGYENICFYIKSFLFLFQKKNNNFKSIAVTSYGGKKTGQKINLKFGNNRLYSCGILHLLISGVIIESTYTFNRMSRAEPVKKNTQL